MSSVAVGIGKLRTANLEQAEAVESVTEALVALREFDADARSQEQA